MSAVRSLAVVAVILLAWGPASGAGRPQKPPPAEVVESGADTYKAHCAACHGPTAVGDGPVAATLRQKPSNLTTIARRRGGKFPRVEVMDFIVGRSRVGAHGTRDMPVWGPLFREINPADSQVDVRLTRLVDHLESLQLK